MLLLGIAGLVWVWVFGLPTHTFSLSNDEKEPVKYTVQVDTNKFFDVYMSADEVLTRTDYSSFYEFKNGSIIIESTKVPGDVVDAPKQIYTTGQTIYRVFDHATVSVSSSVSLKQALDSFENNEPYTVEGYFSDLARNKKPYPTYKHETIYSEMSDGIYVNKDTKKNCKMVDNTLKWYGGDNRFYLVTARYTSMYEAIQELLALAKACYGITFDNYYQGENFVLFEGDGFYIGVRTVHSNSQVVAITNSPVQADALLLTVEGGETYGS